MSSAVGIAPSMQGAMRRALPTAKHERTNATNETPLRPRKTSRLSYAAGPVDNRVVVALAGRGEVA